MCDGASLDEMRFSLHAKIERFGWALQYVSDGRTAQSWCYTVGLAGFDHPELVVVGLEAKAAAGLLNAIGGSIRAGERLNQGEHVVDEEGREFHLSQVHSAHFARGLFAVWVDYYKALGRHPIQAAFEVVPPGRLPRLERASSPIGAPADHHPPRRRRRPNRRRGR